MKKIKKVKDLDYKVNYALILNGVEPFTNIGSKIVDFLDDLINNHNLISSYTWKIVDNIEKHITIKKILKYISDKFNNYRETHEYRDDD